MQKKHIDMCPDCFDAILFQVHLEDNTRKRMALLEEENDMLKLYKKYPEENLEMLFPLFIFYYKQGDDKKAKEYLDRINRANPDFIKFFKGTMKENTKVPDGYYSKGDSSEVIMYFRQYDFLVVTIPTIDYYILENIKKKK